MDRLVESLRRIGALLSDEEVIFCDGRRAAVVRRSPSGLRLMVFDKYGLFTTRRVAELSEARGIVERLK